MVVAAPQASAQTGAGTPASAQAGGIRAIPSAIDVEDGLAGSVTFRPLRLANGIDPAQPFQLAVDGDIASWISFADAADRETPITEAFDDGGGVTVLVRTEIPEEAPVGINEGLLTAVLQNPEAGDEESGPVGVGLAIPIRVNVTGELILAGELLSMNVETTEIGLPARGSVVVRNTGNTTVVPDVTLEIFQGTTSIYRTSSTGSALFPDETDTFEAVWDTTNAAEGDYRATMSVSFESLDLGSREATFKLVESGSLLRQVVFSSMDLVNEPIAGGLARFEVVASNPGQAEIRTVFTGELVRNGEVVEQIRSLDYVVRANDVAVIPIVAEVPENGDYTFSGYLTSESSETETQQVTFTVGAAAEAAGAVPEDSDSGSILPWLIAGLLGLLVVALLVALISRRARKSPSSAGTTAAEPTEAPAGESAR
jgi:hypothetical protein